MKRCGFTSGAVFLQSPGVKSVFFFPFFFSSSFLTLLLHLEGLPARPSVRPSLQP